MVKEAEDGNNEVEARLGLIRGDINGLPNGKLMKDVIGWKKML